VLAVLGIPGNAALSPQLDGMLHAPSKASAPGVIDRSLTREQRAHLLADTSLFRGIRFGALLLLTQYAEAVHYQPYEQIVSQGEPGESVYFVLEGRVEVRASADDGQASTVVSWLSVGDLFGELSLLDGESRSATCVAVTPVRCLRLGRQPFLKALKEHWTLSHRLHVLLSQRLRTADKMLVEYARDPLTGLHNRRSLLDLYEREAERVRRVVRQRGSSSVNPMAVVFCDVNGFKEINDTYGHAAGDLVLKRVADVLRSVGRLTDLVARFGGDEFVMLLPDAGAHGAEIVIRRIRELLQQATDPVSVTVSIGYALVDQEHPQSFEALLIEADLAMYRDKANFGGPSVREPRVSGVVAGSR
jgi:diguanylate cyclase (GGDEF)-like protein